MFNPAYKKQVQLLLEILPLIQQHKNFALKGGTAINLFIQDMPRLSVDIDLAWLPLIPRAEALSGISASLEELTEEISAKLPRSMITKVPVSGVTGRLIVNTPDAQVTIEPNFVFRGALYPTQTRVLCPFAQSEFEQFVEAQTLSLADLYGGKICAALDRQHPRDLFDVHLMFEKFGLTDEIRQAFVIYLAGHHRPMVELLCPNEQPLETLFNSQFSGMTRDAVSVEQLSGIRQQLIKKINSTLIENERKFLLSIKTGEPEWALIPIEHLERLPALQWKIQNIKKMDAEKRLAALQALTQVLQV
ncbi:MAG: nucleotidyl transferase AbiEii/AbiGii toxin family protein [Kiritimatiellales bacterium]